MHKLLLLCLAISTCGSSPGDGAIAATINGDSASKIVSTKPDGFATLAADQTILAREPGNRAALRDKIMTLARLGAAGLATDMSERHPGLLDQKERDSLAADGIASRIRWGGIAANAGRGTARFATLDQALMESEAAGARALDPTLTLSAAERQLALDRIYALSERYRMHDTIALYLALETRGTPVPAYVKAAAASAYLYLEQPQRARDLYRAALATDPDNLQTRLGLFYALAENEEHDAALALIEQIAATTPSHIDAWSPVTMRDNPAYPRVLSTRAMAPLLANQPADAERQLHELSVRAPFNLEVDTSYASSMRARGWPRAAEQELRWVLAPEPGNAEALGERAGALLEMRDYQAAGTALGQAQAVSTEDKRVMRDARLYEVNNMRELIVDGTFGRSQGGPSGGPSGTRDYVLESWLYSQPLDYNYRVFGHAYAAEAQFSAGSGRRERAGMGIEFRSPLLVASGELSHGINGSESGAVVALSFTPDDYWTFRGKLDSSANEIPLQASLAGINARHASADVAWRAQESRSAALSFDHFDFSDGNRRDSTQASWTERVVAGPVYKLEITAALYASSNSLAATPYFNPSRDFSPTLEFSNEWLQWRRYTRAFHHRLVVDIGSYWQRGFGNKPVAGARYEQEWEADDRLDLRYGVGRTLHPYDGAQTAMNYTYFSLNWKF